MRIDKNTTIKLGDKNIVRIKIGDSVIWEKKTVVDETDYFYIESLGDGNTVSVINRGDGSTGGVTPTLEYSTDKNTWNTITFDWTSGTHTTELPVKLNTSEKMYFRNNTRKFSNSNSKYISFSPSVSCNVGGDIRTLSNYLDVDNETTTQKYMFFYLFYNNKNIVDASNLRLPYTTLADYSYESLFEGCSSLTTPPTELPATTLAVGCYYNMFQGCTGLTSAPTLPATTLAEQCYAYMFSYCSKLTTSPELPATKLFYECYREMFRNCTSLVNAPTELPATILKYQCYREMFSGCKSLVNAPIISATTLADYCCTGMFNECTALTSAPELPATTLASDCYYNMFSYCSKLTTVPTELPATKLFYECYRGMFSGCTSLVNAPELPATTLANSCYSSMFSDCTSLVNAPALPATTLNNECYKYMFYGCSKLNSITVYADDISATRCTTNWLSNVASSGTFNNMGFAPFETGASGVPSGWTEFVPEIQSITANPDTFTIKSYKDTVKCTSTLTITATSGKILTRTNSATITVGENTGDTTRTIVETIPYKGSSYQVTIIQTANDVRPPMSWNVVSEGTYPFQLNSNGYYESTNKGKSGSYSYATLNYSGFENLVLECINSGESNYDYGIISQPDVQLSESTSDDGGTGSTKVFKNFKGESSTNPVQIVIPSDSESHFITIKFRKDSSGDSNNDSLQFRVIEPTT